MNTMTTIMVIIAIIIFSCFLLASLIPIASMGGSSSGVTVTARTVSEAFGDAPSTISTAGNPSNLYKDSTVVMELTSEADIKSFVNSLHPGVVVFYAPWCGHCKQFVKPFEKLARSNVDANKDVSFAAVNCVAFSNICTKSPFNIRAFPSLMGFSLETNTSTSAGEAFCVDVAGVFSPV
jgi:thiol-disulfide isomerase/thioredoxin